VEILEDKEKIQKDPEYDPEELQGYKFKGDLARF
jgi:hypothetical protein